MFRVNPWPMGSNGYSGWPLEGKSTLNFIKSENFAYTSYKIPFKFFLNLWGSGNTSVYTQAVVCVSSLRKYFLVNHIFVLWTIWWIEQMEDLFIVCGYQFIIVLKKMSAPNSERGAYYRVSHVCILLLNMWSAIFLI